MFNGVAVTCDGMQALATEPIPGTQVIMSGPLLVQYGVRFLGKLHLSIVPGIVVLDYGDMLTGEEAWDFLLKRSNLHPRAEVIGYRNDGKDDMVFIKHLDLSVPPEALVYTNAGDTLPAAQPTALIGADTHDVPPRLLEYLPHYPTLADWQANINYDR
jgi:hypothetical protein